MVKEIIVNEKISQTAEIHPIDLKIRYHITNCMNLTVLNVQDLPTLQSNFTYPQFTNPILPIYPNTDTQVGRTKNKKHKSPPIRLFLWRLSTQVSGLERYNLSAQLMKKDFDAMPKLYKSSGAFRASLSVDGFKDWLSCQRPPDWGTLISDWNYET